jgi:trigger factor
MPTQTIEKTPDNKVKITVTLSVEETQPYLEEAAAKISESSTIPGFRPGKAGYEVVKQRVGEMKIYEEALETIVRKTYVKAVLENDLETVGSPKIDVVKMAPGNEIIYTAEVQLMPKITRLAEYQKISVKAKTPEVSENEIDLALKDLQRMQIKETRAAAGKKVGATDKAVVAMNMKKDGVPVEGGQSPNHAIYLNEEYYIPGLKEQLMGMGEGEEKKFTLPFPKDHVQKMLAGAEIEFTIGLKELYNLEYPKLDDEFAKTLGQKDFAALRTIIKTNLLKEKESEEKFRQEKEMLEAIVEKSRFENIPDLLLNEEINKMVHELEHRVVEQGLEFDKYLESLKKTLADLKMDFTPQAMIRIKIAMALKEIAKAEKVTVTNEELDQELDALAHYYKDAEEAKKQIYSPEYREYMEAIQRNRKTIEALRRVIIK